MRHSSAKSFGAIILATLFLASAVEGGAVLRLSDLSSDETAPEDLDATLTFDVLGNSLNLLVENDTGEIDGFNISEVYFNAAHSELDLLLSAPLLGWDLLRNQRADGFGTFDFALISDLGYDATRIEAGESLLFRFDIAGSSPVVASDFASDLSTIPPGEHPVVAAVKFVNGPGDDSAYGAVIPEPATIVLLLVGCGLAVSASSRKRRRPAR